MAYRLIQKFVETLGDHPPVITIGSFSPFIIETPWVKDLFNILMIHRGRKAVLAWDENLYHQCSEGMFRKYVEKKVSKSLLTKLMKSLTQTGDFSEDLKIELLKIVSR